VGRLPVIDVSAFQVGDCGQLYLAGFSFNSLSLPVTGGLLAGSNTAGGFQTLTLDVGAARLLFYSPFGTNSGNHTHSGSHRFTRSGTLYQSICDNTRSYAAAPTAYGPTNFTSGYDILTLSINQEVAGGSAATLVAGISRPDSACAPVQLQFGNSSRNAQRYRWTFGDGSPADTTFAPSHLYTVPGTYRVWLRARRTAVGSCGGNTIDSVSVVVRVLSVPGRALPASTVLCPNSSLTLSAVGGAGYTYRWSTGAATRTLAVSQAGTYRVVVSNGACSTRDSVVVRAVAVPRLPADTTLCTNGSLNLEVRAAPGSTVRWDDGPTTSTRAVSTSGTYGVAVTTEGCTFTRQVRVELRRLVQPPNVITPNGDGLNEVFEVRPLEPGTRLQVFNRWGRLVYSTTDYHNDWGRGQAAGLYYYLLENERYCQPLVKGWVEVIP
jgi:gliding motility-associated-like protein